MEEVFQGCVQGECWFWEQACITVRHGLLVCVAVLFCVGMSIRMFVLVREASVRVCVFGFDLVC